MTGRQRHLVVVLTRLRKRVDLGVLSRSRARFRFRAPRFDAEGPVG
jgi:hypothetical protein